MYLLAWQQRKNHHQQVHLPYIRKSLRKTTKVFTQRLKPVSLKMQLITKSYQ